MPLTMRYILYFLLLCIAPLSSQAGISPLQKDALSHAKKAFRHALNSHYESAIREANQTSDRLVKDVVLWIQYQNTDQPASFVEIMDFVKHHPDWPRISRIQTLAEYALTLNTPPSTILEYFGSEAPKTNYGRLLLTQASIAAGAKEDVINNLLREAWKDTDFTPSMEKDFLRDYGNRLRPTDHVARIDRLLWEQKTSQVKRILHLVDTPHQLAFQARMMLMTDHQTAGSTVAKVPTELLNESGLLYERIAWHDRRDHDDKVLEYLKPIKTVQPYPEKWWTIRQHLLRTLLKERRFKDAYDIARYAGNAQGSSDFADSEWLAGWIALQFLDKPQDAYEHLYRMFQSVQFPVSRSRAAYWAGRAADKNGNKTIASDWYGVAASFPTTFYGQLAHMKRFPNQSPMMPEFPVPTKADVKAFRQNDVINAAKILVDAEQYKLAETFLKTAIERAPSKGQLALISELGLHTNQEFLSVVAAKESLRKGALLSKTGYPILKSIPPSNIGNALVLGIIRQESLFDQSAISPSHAVGLMQLLPSTARKVAQDLKVRYSYAKLAQDPVFNVQLGTAYLDQLYRRAGQSYVLSIASYNGGPGNVQKWIKTYGDPRRLAEVQDVIDWIELIPFTETRNYVQRVLENKQIYQYLIHNKPFTLEADLMQGG